MKLIITEEQYNQLVNIDDVFNGLKPYFRRRIEYVNIPDVIEQKVGLLNQYWHKKPTINYLVTRVIHNVIWETIPFDWGGSDDMTNLQDYVNTMSVNIMDKYGEYIKRLVRKKLAE